MALAGSDAPVPVPPSDVAPVPLPSREAAGAECVSVDVQAASGVVVQHTHRRSSAVSVRSSVLSVDSDDDDLSAGHGAGPSVPPVRRTGRRLTVANCRTPLQMCIALACACVLATAPKSSAAFQNKGEWVTITVAMALEGNVGATKRKAALRALGTALGGILGSGVVAFTIGVAPTTTAKVGIMATLLGLSGMFVSVMRARDAGRDYAYVITLTTLALTSACALTVPPRILTAAH